MPKDDKTSDGITEEILKFASAIKWITDQMESLGLFPHHRDIVDCQKCRLYEDIDIDGRLFVYRGEDFENTVQVSFIERKDGSVVCPECGEIVQCPEKGK